MGSGGSETSSDGGAIDKTYVKGIPAILKLLQTVFALIGFICAMIGGNGSCAAINGFFCFVVMAGFVMTLLLWLIRLLKLHLRICKCDCCKWPLIEFVYYCYMVISFFFGSLFMAIFGCKTAHEAACAFGFLALVVYIVDFVLSFRVYLSWKKERHTTSETVTTTTTASGDTTTHTVHQESSVKY